MLRLLTIGCALTALLAAAPAAEAAKPCPGELRVLPGTGETFITKIRAQGVTCANARAAARSYEKQILDPPKTLRIEGRTFTCTRRRNGRVDLGRTTVRCYASGRRAVTWHAEYGI